MASCQKEKIDKDMLEGKTWELIEAWSLFNDSPTHEFYYTDFFPTVYFENGVGLSKVLDKSKNTITNECPFSYKYQGTRISFTEGLFSDVLWDVVKLTDDEIADRMSKVDWKLEESKFKPMLRVFARNVTSTAKGATWE